jgi:cobalt-zinc-cadmium efflux system membrane fusion protein
MKSLLIAPLLALALAGCGNSGDAGHDHPAGADHAQADAARGEHGGRLLQHDGYTVELTIAEAGTPPTYQAWLYRDGKPLLATSGEVDVALTRLGGVRETHALRARDDGRLMAASVVGEPHSFDVVVTARIDGRTFRWSYPSHEGRTVIAAEVARQSGIRVAKAGPGVIADEHEVQGLLTPVEGRVARVMARFPGPIRALRAHVGDHVRAGQPLASIESNLSLSQYTVTAPIGGVVLSRSATVGDVAGEGAPLFEIADLSRLWVDLHVFGADATHLAPGAAVTVTRMSDGASAATTLERVLPGTATASQSTVARATIANTDGLWRPGSAVTARVTVARQPVALAVPLSALQTFRDWDVVFVRVGDTYEVRPLELGRRDATRVEVRSGLRAGDVFVAQQSYLVKADIEKSGASHDH